MAILGDRLRVAMDEPMLLRRPGFGVGDDLLDRGDPLIALRFPVFHGAPGQGFGLRIGWHGLSSLHPDSAMLIVHSRRRGRRRQADVRHRSEPGGSAPKARARSPGSSSKSSAMRVPRRTLAAGRRVGRDPSPLRRRSGDGILRDLRIA